MGAVYFYHLTETALEITLADLLARAASRGWRVQVRGRDDARLAWLDGALWRGDDAGFLAHGLAGGKHDARQPVLLCGEGAVAQNGAACLMAIDGADVTDDEVSAMERVCVLFDGNDAEAMARARVQWIAVTRAGCEAQYWAQDGTRWVKKSQSNGAGQGGAEQDGPEQDGPEQDGPDQGSEMR